MHYAGPAYVRSLTEQRLTSTCAAVIRRISPSGVGISISIRRRGIARRRRGLRSIGWPTCGYHGEFWVGAHRVV